MSLDPPQGGASQNLHVSFFQYPIWTYGLKAPMWLFPPVERRPVIGLLPLTIQADPGDRQARQERETDAGRFTRGIALHLFDDLFFRTSASPIAFVPVAPGVGSVLYGQEWSVESITRHVSFRSPSLVVTGRIEQEGRTRLSMWDLESGMVVWEGSAGGAAHGVGTMAGNLRAFLRDEMRIPAVPPPRWYKESQGPHQRRHLLAIAQLLTLIHVRDEITPRDKLQEEESILRWLSDLAHDAGTSVPKIAFLCGLSLCKTIGLDAFSQFAADAIAMVDSEAEDSPVRRFAPLVYWMFDMPDRFEASSNAALQGADARMRTWVRGISLHRPSVEPSVGNE